MRKNNNGTMFVVYLGYLWIASFLLHLGIFLSTGRWCISNRLDLQEYRTIHLTLQKDKPKWSHYQL